MSLLDRRIVLISSAMVGALVSQPASSQVRSERPPRALILIPGAGGVHPADFLVKTIEIYEAAGLKVEMTTTSWQATTLVSNYKSQGYVVTLVGMSLGAFTVAQAISQGAKPDRVVFAAGGLLPPGTPNGSVVETLGNAAVLPRTLVLHHRADECRMTSPLAVDPFLRWSGGRASVRWINGGGGPGLPCRPDTPHTFAGREREAASAIVAFARGR